MILSPMKCDVVLTPGTQTTWCHQRTSSANTRTIDYSLLGLGHITLHTSTKYLKSPGHLNRTPENQVKTPHATIN